MTGVRALGLQIQGVLMDIPLGDLPLEDLLQQHTGKDDNQVLAELTHVHTALTGLEKSKRPSICPKKWPVFSIMNTTKKRGPLPN